MSASDGNDAQGPKQPDPEVPLQVPSGSCTRPPQPVSDQDVASGIDTVVLTKSPPHMPTRPAAESGRFVDRGQIARGGMSRVHCVFDNLLRRSVAMKVLAGNVGDDVSRFIEEAQITGQLDHPNIVPVYDMGQDEHGVPKKLAMKLVQGQTLTQVVATRTKDPMATAFLEEMLQVFLRVCDAVAFAHSRGVVHRDLKPDNIMVGTHGQVYLMDWGVATLKEKETAPIPTRTESRVHVQYLAKDSNGSLIGTPAFMAPEQAAGLVDCTDERTDTYGLGGILYFVLTGNPPHDGGDVERDLALAKEGHVLPPQQAAPERMLPPGLCRIAMRALAPEPADRYPSAVELKAHVEDFLRGGGWLERARFNKGQVIIEQGAAANAAYIITEGQCELHKGLGDQQRFVRLMGAGEAFGEMAVCGSTTRTATVIAATDVSTLVVTRDALDKELDQRVWMRSLVEAMAERFVELDRKVARLEEELRHLRPSYQPEL